MAVHRVQGVRQGLPVGSDIDGIARKGKVTMAIVGQATLFCPHLKSLT